MTPCAAISRESPASGKPVAIAEVDAVDMLARAREHADRSRVDGDEAREAARNVVAADVERQRAVVVDQAKLPAAARRQAQAAQLQRKRASRLPTRESVRPSATTGHPDR